MSQVCSRTSTKHKGPFSPGTITVTTTTTTFFIIVLVDNFESTPQLTTRTQRNDIVGITLRTYIFFQLMKEKNIDSQSESIEHLQQKVMKKV